MEAPGSRAAQGISTGKAQAWILTTAVLTAVIYAFRRMVEPATPTSKKGASKVAALVGAGPTPPLEQWTISYGAAFMMLSILALGAPELAASLALMGLTGNVLTNGITIASDLTNLEGSTPKTAAVAPLNTPAVALNAGSATTTAGAGIANATASVAAGAGSTLTTVLGGETITTSGF